MSNRTQTPSPLLVQNSRRWLGNDGSWSTFYVHVGTPPQHFHVLPSFDAQTLYVPTYEDCLPDRFNVSDCGGSRGVEVFASKAGVGFQKNASSTWNEIRTYQMNVGFEHGYAGNAVFGYDTVGPSTSGTVGVPTLEKLPVASYSTADFWQGRLGLSMYALNMSDTHQPHSFLSRLKEDGHIPSLSFGYQAGAPYRFTKISGSLVLGGYDRSRMSNDTLLLSSTDGLIAGVQGIDTKLSNGTATKLLDRGLLAFINSDVPELWLPPVVCDAFASAFGLMYHEASDRYLQTETTRALLADGTSALSLTLGTSLSGGRTINIEIPFHAFDLQLDYPIFAAPTNYFPLRRAENDSQITLGRTFLQEVYISADWERDVFNVSQAVFSATMPKPDLVTIPPSRDEESLIVTSGGSTKLSPGLIGGIIGGVIVLVLLLGVVGWWFCYRQRKAKNLTAEVEVQESHEKSDYSYFAPEVSEKSPAVAKTNLELEGRVVDELPAAYEPGFAPDLRRKEPYRMDMAELDCVEPIYELPSQEASR